MSRSQGLSQSSSQSARYIQLLKVFEKASDMSFESIDDANLNECFGSSKTHFGNSLQKLFLNNMVVKTQNNMLAAFKDLCMRYDIDEKMKALDRYDPKTAQSHNHSLETAIDLDEPVSIMPTIITIRNTEKQELLTAISHLEADLKRLTEMAGRLHAQVNNELTAASEERQKIVLASNSCSSNDDDGSEM